MGHDAENALLQHGCFAKQQYFRQVHLFLVSPLSYALALELCSSKVSIAALSRQRQFAERNETLDHRDRRKRMRPMCSYSSPWGQHSEPVSLFDDL